MNLVSVLACTRYLKCDTVGIQVKWDKGGIKPQEDYTFSYGKQNANHHFGMGPFWKLDQQF